MKKIIKEYRLLVIFLAMLCIIIFIILFEYHKNNKIILDGYYYEKQTTNIPLQSIYYFDKDGNCSLKEDTIRMDPNTLEFGEMTTYCKYKINHNELIITKYDSKYYKKIEDTKTYKIKKSEDGIILDNREFLNHNEENMEEKMNNYLENYALDCATKAAKKLNIADYCTTWKKVSDGFYNYSCGLTIRVFVDDTSISYDTYFQGQFSDRYICYKIIKKKEQETSKEEKATKKEETKIEKSNDTEPKTETKEIIKKNNDVYVNNLNRNLKASWYSNDIEEIKITIKGTEKTIKKIDDVDAYIDLSSYTTPGTYDVELKLKLDEDLYDYTIEPKTIKIKIT